MVPATMKSNRLLRPSVSTDPFFPGFLFPEVVVLDARIEEVNCIPNFRERSDKYTYSFPGFPLWEPDNPIGFLLSPEASLGSIKELRAVNEIPWERPRTTCHDGRVRVEAYINVIGDFSEPGISLFPYIIMKYGEDGNFKIIKFLPRSTALPPYVRVRTLVTKDNEIISIKSFSCLP